MSGTGGGSKPKSSRHVYKTGAAGCGGKAAPTAAKNSGAPLPCPFCERIFKQDGRLKEHLKNKHADGNVDGPQSTEDGTAVPPDSADFQVEAPVSEKGQGYQDSSYPVKTPKTLLHEWCQKNKRPAPKFKHVEETGGFHCRVILPDAKKAEADVILWYRGAPTRTSQEAQHRAAVIGLHHVLGNRRLDRILAEEYRQQWHDLDEAVEKRKAFLKANPPQVRPRPVPLPRELHSVFMSENNRRLVEGLLRMQDNGDATSSNIDITQDSQLIGSGKDGSEHQAGIGQRDYHQTEERFSRIAAPVDTQIEDNWEQRESSDLRQLRSPGKLGNGKATTDVRRKLLNLGFGAHHVDKALSERHDMPSALDWLILNVPEHELPVRFAPGSSKASVQVLVRGKVMPSAISAKPGKEMSSSLQEYGYAYSDCVAALSEADGDEEAALGSLFHAVFGGATQDEIQHLADVVEDMTEVEESRAEEMAVLHSIFGEQIFVTDSHLAFEIAISDDISATLDMEVRIGPGSTYPLELPVIAFRSEELPAEILLDLTGQVVEKAVALLGNPMIHELYIKATDLASKVTSNSIAANVVNFSVDNVSSNLKVEEAPLSKNNWDDEDGISFPSTRTTRSQITADPLPRTYVPPALRTSLSKTAVELQQKHERDVVPSASDHHPQHSLKPKTNGPEIDNVRENSRLTEEWEQLRKSKRHADMWAVRARLPAFQQRDDVLSVVNSNQIVIVAGQTGCGKSTQVPQYILEDYVEKGKGSLCNIICTQPRRLSAIGLADRVSKERGQAVGETIGYSVRLETSRSYRTRLLFCTIGILLRRLLSDQDLEGVTHVVVDEVHERSLDSDLLLFFLREILRRKSGLRLILMSATVDTDLFVRYFKQDSRLAPCVVTIPGFTFPVQEFYLEDALDFTGHKVSRNSRYAMKKRTGPSETANTDLVSGSVSVAKEEMDDWEALVEDGTKEDEEAISMDHYDESTKQALNILDQSLINYDLIELIIGAILRGALTSSTSETSLAGGTKDRKAHPGGTAKSSGAILVFLPGIAEIRKLQKQLQSSTHIAGSYSGSLWVLALHGSLSSDEQRRVFTKAAPKSTKIVLATNIAETSVTIDDVVYVIDTGRHKEMRYDHSRGLSCLEETWISKASAKQRRGRAGRVQSGFCIRLCSRQNFKTLEDQQLPEILRVSLDGLCLKIKSLIQDKVEVAASKIITPPDAGAVKTSLKNLQDLNALDSDEELTPLGHHLARMPVDARVGKMLLFGCMLKCLDPVVTIASALSGRSPFVSPSDKRDEANASRLRFAGASKSDHWATVAGYNGWLNARQEGRGAESNYCSANFLSRETLLGIEASRKEFFKILADIGFLTSAEASYPGSDAGLSGDTNASSIRVVKAVICAGFYPNIVRAVHPEKTYVHTEGGTVARLAQAREIRFFTKADGRVFIHPASVNFSIGKFESPWLIFAEKMKTSKVFLKDSTMVPAYGLLLFGGKVLVKHEKQAITVDDWLEFEAPARIAVLIKELRSKVEGLLAEKIERPNLDISSSPVVSALIRLLTTDGF